MKPLHVQNVNFGPFLCENTTKKGRQAPPFQYHLRTFLVRPADNFPAGISYRKSPADSRPMVALLLFSKQQFSANCVHGNDVFRSEFSLQNQFGQRIFDLLLNRPL